MNQDIGLFINPNTDFGSLYNAYRKCAELLLDEVVGKHRAAEKGALGGLLSMDNSQLVYPLFFSYRQSLELHLKKCLQLSSPEPAECKIHDLKCLYSKLLRVAKDELDPRVYGNLAAAKQDLLFLHTLDASGTGFRYEEANHGRVCILRLRDTYGRIYDVLESVRGNFDAIRDSESSR